MSLEHLTRQLQQELLARIWAISGRSAPPLGSCDDPFLAALQGYLAIDDEQSKQLAFLLLLEIQGAVSPVHTTTLNHQ